MKSCRAALLVLVTMCSAHAYAMEECAQTPEVLSETSLRGQADYWFGSPEFRFAIMTATNARAADPRFAFISDPHNLPTGTTESPNHICIPRIAEAERLKLRFDRYLQAVHDMTLAEPSEEVDTLDPVPATGPVTVVSWVRSDQVKHFPSAGSMGNAKGAMWVTLAPHLKEFCQAYAKNNTKNIDQISLRLEQRLGLAPASSKTHFVELEIAKPHEGNSIFRPCGNPNISTTSCAVGGPALCDADKGANCEALSKFFYEQFYNSYGRETPTEFPWTSLGYTFDWAPDEVGLGGVFDYVQVGESEYVVNSGAEFKVQSVQTTAEYCGLK